MSYIKFFRRLAGKSPLGIGGLIFVSLFVNMLYLISPIYMMHVYDTVIGANSEVNLYAISAIAIFCYLMFFFFDLIRAKLLTAIAPSIEASFDRHCKQVIQNSGDSGSSFLGITTAIDRLGQFAMAPTMSAFFDAPFVPIFIALGFFVHPLLGLVGIISTVLLVSVTLIYGARGDTAIKSYETLRRNEALFGKAALGQRDFIKTSSDRSYILSKWLNLRQAAHNLQFEAASINSTGLSITKTLRFVMQSTVLGLGAWLVLQQVLSPGAIIAASIVLSRALMPIEQAIAARRTLHAAKDAMATLDKLEEGRYGDDDAPNAANSEEGLRDASLIAKALTFRYESQNSAILNKLSFAVPNGSICVVTGPNSCGKTTLLRCLLGLLPLEQGDVLLGNIKMLEGSTQRFSNDVRYLAQYNELFPVSVRQNVKWQDGSDEDSRDVVGICKLLGCHNAILSLEDGYDTIPFDENGCVLSPGLVQNIALARTLLGNPQIVFLDEPLQFLDNVSVVEFKKTIEMMKNAGKTVIMVTHDPRAIDQSDLILIFHPVAGPIFGPTKEVISKLKAAESQRAGAPML